MFAALGTVMTGLTGRRTHAPIRRHSKPAGQCEATIWRGTTRRDTRQIVLAARRYEIAMKPPGKRTGPLGAVALEVLELLANLVDYRTGRLEPSLDTMMRKLRRSRDAVVRALKALRDHGFVDWLRRFVPTDNEGSKGPQVRQTSNAYRLAMPAKARACLGRYGEAPPLPEDGEQATAERAAALEAYSTSLSIEDILSSIEDARMRDSLTRFRLNMLKKRESVERTESRPESIYKEERTPLSGSLTRPCGGSGPR